MSPTSAVGAQVRMKSTSGGRTISFSHSGSTATYVVEQAVQLSTKLAQAHHIMRFINTNLNLAADVVNAAFTTSVAADEFGGPVIQAVECAKAVCPRHSAPTV